MRIYSLILIIPLILQASCIVTSDEKEKKRYERNLNFQFLYFVFYQPYAQYQEEKRVSCSQPNAIDKCGGLGCSCTSSKVSDGLIYNSDTLAKITTETISPGITLQCLCPNKEIPRLFIWARGVAIDDIPANNPALNRIFLKGYNDIASTFKLTYQTHYKPTDNLYCIAECVIDTKLNDYYQFLKIR